MGKSSAHATDYLQLLFQNQNMPNVGDSTGLRGSSSSGGFWIALMTNSVTEASYTNYSRLYAPRISSVWQVSGTTVFNKNDFTFNYNNGGTQNVTHFAIYTSQTGGTQIGVGALTANTPINGGDTPKFLATDLTITES